MSTTTANTVVADPVTVTLSDLELGIVPSSTLLSAFGPSSLGIIIVTSLPERFAALRTLVLSHASNIAALPPTTLTALESPSTNYLTGWSHGKEKLAASGRPDALKGSFYINCGFYSSSSSSQDTEISTSVATNPEYPSAADNIWPPISGFQDAVTELCTLIIDTAVLVARACDRYAQAEVEGYRSGYLEHVVRTSTTTKARLLHYFPRSSAPNPEEENEDDSWCGTHVDHGCLTGLTSAMYIDESAHSPTGTAPLPEVLGGPPDPDAGLYIRDRTGRVVKVSIPRDALAFQTGEALERITNGRFKAVPHFVKGLKHGIGNEIARNTLAVFTQPNLWEKVDGDIDFAAFAKAIVERNMAK